MVTVSNNTNMVYIMLTDAATDDQVSCMLREYSPIIVHTHTIPPTQVMTVEIMKK